MLGRRSYQRLRCREVGPDPLHQGRSQGPGPRPVVGRPTRPRRSHGRARRLIPWTLACPSGGPPTRASMRCRTLPCACGSPGSPGQLVRGPTERSLCRPCGIFTRMVLALTSLPNWSCGASGASTATGGATWPTRTTRPGPPTRPGCESRPGRGNAGSVTTIALAALQLALVTAHHA